MSIDKRFIKQLFILKTAEENDNLKSVLLCFCVKSLRVLTLRIIRACRKLSVSSVLNDHTASALIANNVGLLNGNLDINVSELFGCNAQLLFKISPDETLNIVQQLYEKKMVTYPRTDARVLSTAVAKEIYKNSNGLKGVGLVSGFASEIAEKGM